MENVLIIAADKYNGYTFFQPSSRITFYDLRPTVDKKKTLSETKKEIASIIKEKDIKIVSVEFIHFLKRWLDLPHEQFWTELFDLADESYRIVQIDVRGYPDFVLRNESRWRGRGKDRYYYEDKFGTGDTDFTQFFRPNDIYMKNQIIPTLHDSNDQLFVVPYIAPYTRTTHMIEDFDYGDFTREHDTWFIGAMTRRVRHDLVERVKDLHDVDFVGGITDMNKLLRKDGEFPPKFRGCSLEHSTPRMGFEQYLKHFRKTKIALSVYGVGNICIRMMESMASKTACLSDEVPLNNVWLVKPEKDKHCFFYKNDWSDFESEIRRVLENTTLRDEVAVNGYWFWKRYHRKKSVGIFVDTLISMFNKGYSKDEIYSEARKRIDLIADEDGIEKQ